MLSNRFDEAMEDAMDEAMRAYTDTDEYKLSRHEINKKIAAFRSTLSKAQSDELTDILDIINDADSQMSVKAFKIGFAQGVCFREETIIK